MGDRRQHERVDWRGNATAETGGHRMLCEGIDLSRSGVALRSWWYAYPGKPITVSFELDGAPVTMHGVVVWSTATGGHHTCGVRFTVAHPSHKRRIAAFVRERLERRPGLLHLSRRRTVVPLGAGRDQTRRLDPILSGPETPDYQRAPEPGVPVPVRTGSTQRIDLGRTDDCPIERHRKIEQLLSVVPRRSHETPPTHTAKRTPLRVRRRSIRRTESSTIRRLYDAALAQMLD